MSDSGAIDGLPADAPYPGITRRTLDGESASLVWYAFEPGASFPVHRHRQEQMTVVERGTVTMRVGPDSSEELSVGAWSVIEPWLEHGITAGPDGARIMIALVPRRADGEQVEVLTTDDERK